MTSADDLPRDWWSTTDVASYIGATAGTVRNYAMRNQMPPPDRTIPGRNFWRPRTIIKWHKSRPRVGKDQPEQ